MKLLMLMTLIVFTGLSQTSFAHQQVGTIKVKKLPNCTTADWNCASMCSGFNNAIYVNGVCTCSQNPIECANTIVLPSGKNGIHKKNKGSSAK